MTKEASDIFGMSDEEFLSKEMELQPTDSEEPLDQEEALEESSESTNEEESYEEHEESVEEDYEDLEESVQQTEQEVFEDSSEEEIEEGSEKDSEETEDPEVNYRQFYETVMAPFKANGRQVELKTPEEAIQLMQMGANYTKNMQIIAPYRKALLMLERNNLLDEDKLSYLIDLDKKNPEAIQKLLKDAEIDPLDIDTDSETTYVQGNHRVSDEEAALVSAVEELRSLSGGEETLREITSNWDQASKDVLWGNPYILSRVHSHRQNGIYEKISNEIHRQKTVGELPASVSFIQAYQSIGDQMQAAGEFDDIGMETNARTPNTTRRTGRPKSKVTNNRKAAAASSTRSTPTRNKEFPNPLEMSDEEFLKQFEGRL